MLQTTDIFTKVGYTVIDDVRVVQYTCQIPLAKPESMTVRQTVLNQELYKQNRKVCREEYAEFEDQAYELQETYLKSQE